MNELTPLQKAQAEMKRRRDAGEKIVHLTPREKMEKNPRSLKARINCNCWECANEIRSEITHCAVNRCPFWDIRPYQPKQ
jgi:hypothetical protein